MSFRVKGYLSSPLVAFSGNPYNLTTTADEGEMLSVRNNFFTIVELLIMLFRIKAN